MARRAHERGPPTEQSLGIQYPDDPAAVAFGDEYLLGDALLVAPIWRSRVGKREVYLPAGTWREVWRPETAISGPARVALQAPLHRIPAFVADGAAVDFGDLDATWTRTLERTRVPPDPETLAVSKARGPGDRQYGAE